MSVSMIGGSYNWKLFAITKETDDAITIVFDNQGQRFDYKPGQYVNVQLVIEEERVSRSYSLSSSPAIDERPAITIKKVESGKMSSYLFHRAAQIKGWEIDGPYGSFIADPNNKNIHNMVLIGGGSGMTPLYSMLKTFLKQRDTRIFLIDCNRTWQEVIFAEAITKMEKEYEDRLQVHHFLSRESKESLLSCAYTTEKLSKLLLKKTLKKWLGPLLTEAEYFLCGPSGLIKMSQETLQSQGIDASNIHTEYFSIQQEDVALVELPQSTKEVLLHFYEQSNLLEVHPNRSILETALEDKIPLSYSCKNGTCGKCAGKLTAGKVHMNQNYALTEDHLKEGFILLCQSHPLDDEVVIEIG